MFAFIFISHLNPSLVEQFIMLEYIHQSLYFTDLFIATLIVYCDDPFFPKDMVAHTSQK